MITKQHEAFVDLFEWMQESVHATAVEKGWWKNRRRLELSHVSQELEGFAVLNNQISCVGLVMTELGELVDGLRVGNGPDDKIPEFSSAEAEAADAVIRIMDMCQAYGWNLAGAIVAKAEMNKGRDVMHGGKKA